MQGANVFTEYRTTGDWLIVADVNNTYLPYYPNSDPQALFQLQLINGATIVASNTFKAWQRQPLSIYLSPATANTLTWGTNYKVRIQLLGSAVYSEYALLSTDWQSGSILYLDGYVRNLAGILQEYYTTLTGAAVTYLTDATSGAILTSAGGVIFDRGISLLSTYRPNLFKFTNTAIPTSSNLVSSGAAQARIIMSDRVGAQLYGVINGIADGFGLDPVEFVSSICWGLLILCAILCGAGQFAGGIISGAGFIGIGVVFGAITFAMVGIMILLAIVIIGMRVFINNSG